MTELTLARKKSVIKKMRKMFTKTFSERDWYEGLHTTRHGIAYRAKGLCEFFELVNLSFSWVWMCELFPELNKEIKKSYNRVGRNRGGYVNWERPITSRLALLNRVEKQLNS